MKPTAIHRWRLGAAVCMAAVCSFDAAAAISGAIFTSNGTANAVNQNQFDVKTDVYLNGGPQNGNSGALSPDGVYYFEVTTPNGDLLSTDDAVCRQVTVSQGAISGTVTDPNCTTAPHVNGAFNSISGTTPVQLYPFADTTNNGNEYKVYLISKGNAVASGPYISCQGNSGSYSFAACDTKSDNFKVLNGDNTPPPPPQTFSLSGLKFYDANANGILDSGEVGIPGWKIELSGAASSNTTTTLVPVGQYSFMNLFPGAYNVCEVLPNGAPTWKPTGPASLPVTITGANSTGNNFGNVCLGSGSAYTLGFWSNPNGQKILSKKDSAWRVLLDALNLKNAKGVDYDAPTAGTFANAYSNFRSWLLGATATNMAYMLSAQLATMELNVAYGGNNGGSTPSTPVPAGAIVYAGAAPTGCTVPGLGEGGLASGFITIGNLMDAANATSNYSLYNASSTTALNTPARNCQEFMKTTLDDANNNRNFVQSGLASCVVNYTGTEKSCSTP